MELEFSGLDKRLFFVFQHRGNSLSRVSYLLSDLHKMAGSALAGFVLHEDQGKGDVTIECKFSADWTEQVYTHTNCMISLRTNTTK